VRVVCDTNVLIAALVADGLCRDIVKRRLPRVDLFVSLELLRELDRTLRGKFGAAAATLPFLKVYRERAQLVTPDRLPAPVCRDPDDDVVIATAIAARADVILTGDDDLLVLRRHGPIRILSPRQFVELLDR
jgi:putative PIN family toxin of toxin-antitoxin system